MKKMLIIFISLLFLSFNSVNASSSSARYMDEYNLNKKVNELPIAENNYQSNTVISKRGKLASYRSNIITPDAIIGDDDDRVIIDDYRESPYSAVCQITVDFSGGGHTYGTGFLISDNIIATAAHAFHQPGRKSTKVIGITAKFYDKEYDLTNYYISSDYKTSYNEANDSYETDYAFIEVPSNIGNKYGYFGVYSTNNYDNYLNKQVKAIGYAPEAIGDGTEVERLYESSGNIFSIDTSRFVLRHNADTVRSESGGALRFLYSTDKKYQVCGIHVGGSSDYDENLARLFDLDLTTWLESRGMI